MKLRTYLRAVLVAIMALAGMTAAIEGQSVESVAEGNSRFAVDLYQQAATEEGNLFFSPYSITTALAMAYAGASGVTEQEMAEVLYFDTDQNELHSSLSIIQNELNAIQAQGQIELSIANLLWCAQKYPFLDSYLELNRRFYDADFRVVDFAHEAEVMRLAANDWVEEKTKKKITDLFPPGSIDKLTRLILCNAIYFKGNWLSKFDEDDTEDEHFNVTSRETVVAPMMRQKWTFRYASFDGHSAIELPYEGERLSMMIFLPHEIDGLADFESSLTFDSLNSWITALASRRPATVKVIMPTFKTTRELALARILQEMGMPSAFRPDAADFSAMSDGKDLYIHAVVHKAFVDVNEEGTEAAAATGITVGITSVSPAAEPVFRADHPFMFLIRENQTGSILFMGRITDPTEE